jgi:plastocyanin domain-containing protein
MKTLVLVALSFGLVVSPASADKARRIDIKITTAGFTPDKIRVARNERVTLRFERKTEKTCVKEVIIETGKEKIERKLPLDQPVEVSLTFRTAGELTYACGMNMFTGIVIVQ